MIEDRFMKPERSPWLVDEHAEPRADAPFESDRGLQPKRRFILPIDVTGAWKRVRSWLRG